MPTSSFFKHYYVPASKADEFVEMMVKEVPPTLKKDFQSQFKHEKELRPLLEKALENL